MYFHHRPSIAFGILTAKFSPLLLAQRHGGAARMASLTCCIHSIASRTQCMTCLMLTEHHHDRCVSVKYIVEHFDQVEPLLCHSLPRPMQGFYILLHVYSRYDEELYILHPIINGRHLHLDCRRVMGDREFNMLEQAGLSAVNDGRHPMLFSQVLTSDRTEVWDLFINVLQLFFWRNRRSARPGLYVRPWSS